MTIIRKNPLQVREQVTACIHDDSSSYIEGHCPECQKQMLTTQIGDAPAYVCVEHRIVLPVKLQSVL